MASAIIYGIKFKSAEMLPWEKWQNETDDYYEGDNLITEWWSRVKLSSIAALHKYPLHFPLKVFYTDDESWFIAHPHMGFSSEDPGMGCNHLFDPRKLKASNGQRDKILGFCKDFGIELQPGQKPMWYFLVGCEDSGAW